MINNAITMSVKDIFYLISLASTILAGWFYIQYKFKLRDENIKDIKRVLFKTNGSLNVVTSDECDKITTQRSLINEKERINVIDKVLNEASSNERMFRQLLDAHRVINENLSTIMAHLKIPAKLQ
jgi:uncharacterized membrane protein YcaP (DUF421 family)